MHNVLVWTMRFNLFLICFFFSLALLRGLNMDKKKSRREWKISILISAIRDCVISTCNLYRANNYKWEFIDLKLIRPAVKGKWEERSKGECAMKRHWCLLRLGCAVRISGSLLMSLFNRPIHVVLHVTSCVHEIVSSACNWHSADYRKNQPSLSLSFDLLPSALNTKENFLEVQICQQLPPDHFSVY